MKRFLSVLLSTALLASMTLGCASQGTSSAGNQANLAAGSTNSTASGAASGSNGEKTPVSIWYYWETQKHQQSLDKVIKTYNSSQNKIEVSAKYVPFADFKKQLSIGATASKLPDIVIMDSPDMASYASMGIFADLTDKLKDWDGLSQYYEGPLNSCKLDGKLYGIPFGSNCLALFYNETMLKEANCKVPTTWDELKDVAKKTTKGKVKGMGMSCVQNEEGTFTFMPWLWSTGTTAYQVNNDKGIKALTLVKDLVSSGSMSKEVINWTQGDVMNQFISGNLAMMVNGPWQVPTMREQAKNLKWNVALLPKDTQNASVLGGENFGVINGKHVDQALEFLKCVTTPDVLKGYINDFGYIAARKDVAATQFSNDATMQLFTQEMQYAKPRGPHPQWPEISDAISLAVNESITGGNTPAAAAAKAQKTIDGIVKK